MTQLQKEFRAFLRVVMVLGILAIPIAVPIGMEPDHMPSGVPWELVLYWKVVAKRIMFGGAATAIVAGVCLYLFDRKISAAR